MTGTVRSGLEAVKQGSHDRGANPRARAGSRWVACTRRRRPGRPHRAAMPIPVLALPAAGAVAAQATARARLLAELDRDVRRPYMAGVRADSAPLWEGVLARDFHWVAPGPRGRIMDRAEYDADSRAVMHRRRAEGAARPHRDVRGGEGGAPLRRAAPGAGAGGGVRDRALLLAPGGRRVARVPPPRERGAGDGGDVRGGGAGGGQLGTAGDGPSPATPLPDRGARGGERAGTRPARVEAR